MEADAYIREKQDEQVENVNGAPWKNLRSRTCGTFFNIFQHLSTFINIFQHLSTSFNMFQQGKRVSRVSFIVGPALAEADVPQVSQMAEEDAKKIVEQ